VNTSPWTILIVDDEPGVLRVLARVLESSGYCVLLATNGEEACELLEQRGVDYVLMDLRMPSMSGQTLYHLISTQWPHLTNRVIVMTGDPEAEDQIDWLGLHDLPVLVKPFELSDVLDLIQQLVRERRKANGN
jgi:DNA-binding response OmpR family regulator